MNDADSPEDEEEEATFSCRIDNSKTISEILTCLCINRKDHICHIEASPESVMFVVTGKSKATQARVNLEAELFDDYTCETPVRLSLNLNMVLDCLDIFGSSSETTTATISYSTKDVIFKLSLEEAGVMTTCEVAALYSDDFDEVQNGLLTAFRNSAEICQVMIKSEQLKDAIQELNDVAGAATVRVKVDSAKGMMLSATGNMGICDINFPRESDAFLSLRCDRSVKRFYPVTSLQLGMKALNVAKETYIRINDEGIMGIQHQLESSNGFESYIDFLMLPQDVHIGGEEDGGEERKDEDEDVLYRNATPAMFVGNDARGRRL